MVSPPGGETFVKICLYSFRQNVRTWQTDRQTDRKINTQTPHDAIGRACIASRSKNHNIYCIPCNHKTCSLHCYGRPLRQRSGHYRQLPLTTTCLSPACIELATYIDYVRRSRSSSCRLLRPINCQTYITLHYNWQLMSSHMLFFCRCVSEARCRCSWCNLYVLFSDKFLVPPNFTRWVKSVKNTILDTFCRSAQHFHQFAMTESIAKRNGIWGLNENWLFYQPTSCGTFLPWNKTIGILKVL